MQIKRILHRIIRSVGLFIEGNQNLKKEIKSHELDLTLNGFLVEMH